VKALYTRVKLDNVGWPPTVAGIWARKVSSPIGPC